MCARRRIEFHVKNRTVRRLQRDRTECAFVDRAARIERRFHGDEHAGTGDGERTIHHARHLRIGPLEVGRDVVSLDRHLELCNDRIERAGVEKLQIIFVVIVAVRQFSNTLAQPLFGTVEMEIHRAHDFAPGVFRDQAADALLRDPARAKHGVQITFAFFRHAHVCHQQGDR